jgi:hypothetical protein
MVARKAKREATPVPEQRTGDSTGDTSGTPPARYLDETGSVPRIGSAERGPQIHMPLESITAGGKPGWYAVIREVNPVTSAMAFGVAVKVTEKTGPDSWEVETGYDGKAQRYLIKRSPKPVIVWVGTIDVIAKYRTYAISASATLERKTTARYISVRAVKADGITTSAEIALMNMRATGDRAQWIDDLDLHGSGQMSMLKAVIIAMAESLPDDHVMLHGQGPVYLDDDTMIFAAKSVVYDEHGTVREDIRVDIKATVEKAYLRYYDITPRKLITDEQVKDGIAELRLALTESPEYPEIPAAFTGQMYTSPLATIYRELWSGLHLSGTRGSGKTFYATRWDSVQSRDARGRLSSIRPAMPLGDSTGTIKGPQYRSAIFGGYAITTDDVIKSGNSEFRIREQAEKIENLVRSHETGASPRAHVNYAVREVKDNGNTPELMSSVKITSEKPIPGDSLQNRLIMLPHLTQTWGRGGFFSREVAERLSTPESRELQHRAWSAYVYYLVTNHAEIMAHLASAQQETATWDIESRQADRYAVLIAGHYMFREFAATYGIDYSDDVASIIAALRECAKRQAGSSTPLAERFAEALRLEIRRGHLSYPGPPLYDPDGTQSATYSTPGVMVPGEPGEDGVGEDKRELWGFDYDQLGLVLGNGTAVARTPSNVTPLGYLVPPRMDTGGKSGNPLAKRPLIAHKPEQFTALCEQLTRTSRDKGWVFDRKDVIKSLQDTGTGDNSRISVSGKQDRYVYIDAEFALKTPDEAE